MKMDWMEALLHFTGSLQASRSILRCYCSPWCFCLSPNQSWAQKLCQELPRHVRLASELPAFKSHLKTHFLYCFAFVSVWWLHFMFLQSLGFIALFYLCYFLTNCRFQCALWINFDLTWWFKLNLNHHVVNYYDSFTSIIKTNILNNPRCTKCVHVVNYYDSFTSIIKTNILNNPRCTKCVQSWEL